MLSLVAVALLVHAAPGSAPASAPITAVFEIEDTRKKRALPADVLLTLSEYFSTTLGESGAFRIVPRAQIRAALTAEKKESYRSCYDEACQIEVGKELAAEKSLKTQILELDSKTCAVISALYDLKSGLTERSAQSEGACDRAAVRKALIAVAGRMAGGGAELEGALALRPKLGRGSDDPRARKLLGSLCSAGRQPACTELAWMEWHGFGGDRDRASAARRFTLACEQGDGRGCAGIGWMSWFGSGVDPDRKRGHAHFERGCRLGAPMACEGLGAAHRDGQGVKRDRSKARALFQQGCDARDSGSCVSLGLMLREDADLPRARALLGLGCELGHPWGCGALASMDLLGEGGPRDLTRAALGFERAHRDGDQGAGLSLAEAYKEGRGVPLDEARAVELMRSVCDPEEPGSCGHLAWMIREGRGVAHDLKEAARIFRADCEIASASFGNAWTCAAIGDMERDGLGVPKDEAAAERHAARAAEKARRGCDLADPWACFHLAMLLEQGRGVAKDPARALALERAACDQRIAFGCTWVGVHDKTESARFLERGCDLGDGGACWHLANQLGADPARAAALVRRGCEDGNGWACLSLARAFRDGNGIDKSASEAKTAATRARRILQAYARGGSRDAEKTEVAMAAEGL
jgi:TPR repeat protein